MLTARASKFVLSSKTSVPYKSDVCTQRSVGQRVKIKGETRSGGRASTMDESAKKTTFRLPSEADRAPLFREPSTRSTSWTESGECQARMRVRTGR
jgi:hypothetical protein